MINSSSPFEHGLMEKLIEVSDHEILINFSLDCKCRTDICLRSLIGNAHVAFKVQTSSPNKFLVNPPTGLIPPLSSATFQVVLRPQTHVPESFPRSHADRFLIRTAAAPDLSSESPESTQPELLTSWFSSDLHPRCFDVKLRVCFVGPFLLAHAAGSGDYVAVKRIIKRQRSIVADFAGTEAESLYRTAAPFPDILGLLLEAGLRVDVGQTEIHAAAHSRSTDRRTAEIGDHRTAEMLLEPGAVPTIGDVGSHRPAAGVAGDKCHLKIFEIGQLLDVVQCGDLDALESLLKTSVVATNLTDCYGLTPLHMAAAKGNRGAIEMLVGSGADVDPMDTEGHTPLHLAVQGGSIESVRILLALGAGPNIETNRGATPVHIARLMGEDGIEQLLVANGAASL